MPAKSTGCYFFMYGGAIDSDLIGAAVGGSVSTGSIGGVSAGGGSGGGASSFNPEAYNCKAAQCSSGQTEYEFCENCGTRERSCTSSGAWGAWGSCNNLS
jgi:hypothetical protein